MKTLRNLITQYPLASFFILAYTLSWWSVPLTGGQIIPHGPAIAGLILFALSEGRAGFARLWQQRTQWQVTWRWLLIAPGILIALHFGALLLNLSLGAAIVLPVSMMLPLLIELIVVGGAWEEPGWSGYALPRLQARFARQPYGLLIASLVMGVFRAIWHLPLALYGFIPWIDVLIFSIAFQFIISWLYNRSQGSVVVTMLFHLTNNIVFGVIMSALFTGSDHRRYYLIFVGLACLTAVFLARPKMGSRKLAEVV